MPVLKNPCYYVYALVDPRDNAVFYIGKGKGERHSQHFKEWHRGIVSNAAKFERIGSIIAAGAVPRSVILKCDMTEGDAFSYERRVIRVIGIENLTNVTPGQRTQREKTVAWARYWFRRVKPFDRWVVERPHPQYEIDVYRKVVKSIASMAMAAEFHGA